MKLKGPILLLSIFLLSLCGEKVREFNGFTQKEMEFLLASDDIKAWERISRLEDGEEVEFDPCEFNHFIYFEQGGVGSPKPLYYSYNTSNCDSVEFCDRRPGFCEAHESFCEENPETCSELPPGFLIVGTWYAKEPFIQNSRSDTLVFDINEQVESIFVTDITANFATFLYKDRSAPDGGDIIENYQYFPPSSE